MSELRRITDTPAEEVKRAVKEALDDKRMDDLSHQITDLATQMTKGFAEVHTKQDTTNGKVVKHEALWAAQTSKGNYDKLLWLVVTTLVGVVVFFVTKGNT